MRKQLDPGVEKASGNFLECGLSYSYCPGSQKLSLLDGNTKSILMWVQCKDFMHSHIDDYICIFDKAIQIQALRISAHNTIKIHDVMDREKLSTLLHSTAHTARHVLSLDKKRFEEFSAAVQAENGLKTFYIKLNKGTRFTLNSDYEGHYTARLKIFGHHSVTVRSSFLHQLLLYLADSINLDLATSVYASGKREQATDLMNLASQALFMSQLLDPHYEPAKELYSSYHLTGAAE